MCASDQLTMEADLISRSNSTSTSRTLVASEDGISSPTATPLSIIDQKLQTTGPIIQTKDNKQWIDLDSISPKLLRELRRQYEVSGDEKGALSKGAAKVKAWTRQTKLGFDIRLRRKISPEHDEVTDFCLVRNPMPMEEKFISQLPDSELPTNAVFELADTAVVPELSVIRDERCKPDEALPRYEPPPGAGSQRPRLHLETLGLPGDENLERSPSESSIVATPTKGLSLIDVDNIFAGEDKASERGSTDTKEQEPDTTEQIRALLKILKDQLSSQAEKDGGEELKLAGTKRYDVKANAEAESGPQTPATVRPSEAESGSGIVPETPGTRKEVQSSPRGRKKTHVVKRGRTTNKLPKRNPFIPDDDPESTLPRRLTLPRRVEASDGPEAVWRAVLKAQAKILGAEHPLIWSSRHAMSLNRVQHHRDCSPSLLASLHESETTATQTLGDTGE